MNLQLTKQLRLSDGHASARGSLRLVVRRGPALSQQVAYAAGELVTCFEHPATAAEIVRSYTNAWHSRTLPHREILDCFCGRATSSKLELPIEVFGQFSPLP